MKKTWLIVAARRVGIGILGGCASSGGDDSAPEPSRHRRDPTVLEPTPEQPADEPLVNTLKWTTASEVDNFGFDIYRGLSEDGPFDRITAEPLPGAGTTDEPQNYVFVDESIDPEQGLLLLHREHFPRRDPREVQPDHQVAREKTLDARQD